MSDSLQMKSILEGLLFITGDEGLTLEQATSTLEASKEEVEQVLEELKKDYSEDSHGVELAQFGNVYKFLSKKIIHEYASKLFALEKNSKLSPAALETLAIIAYKQPVTRVEIEEIRGVGADVMLRKLQARGLIEESGRSDAPGKPILYSVTDAFMDAFELMSLEELPELPRYDNEEEKEEDLFGN